MCTGLFDCVFSLVTLPTLLAFLSQEQGATLMSDLVFVVLAIGALGLLVWFFTRPCTR